MALSATSARLEPKFKIPSLAISLDLPDAVLPVKDETPPIVNTPAVPFLEISPVVVLRYGSYPL